MDDSRYTLLRTDEIMVINAAAITTVNKDTPAYTLLITRADGRWLVLNQVTGNATEAARLLHETRKAGRIELADWTDVSFLRARFTLDTDKALRVGVRPSPRRAPHRPPHPENAALSVLREGDAARIIRVTSPADPAQSWWLITLTLAEGVILQHALPFETSDEALDLVKLMARTNAYVTEDFFDATDEMQSVWIDHSEEREIDRDGQPRVH